MSIMSVWTNTPDINIRLWLPQQLRKQMELESADRTSSHEQIVTRYREQATSKELECSELKDTVDDLTIKL